MTICRKCKAENRPEAAFCANCGSILLAQPSSAKPVPTKPVESEPTEPSTPELMSPGSVPSVSIPSETVAPEPDPIQPVEPPATLIGFEPQPEGSIFGERFQFDTLVYQDEHENVYTVMEICEPLASRVSTCSNPQCRTIHVPTGTEQEKFCTRCGHPMDQLSPLLVLQEADTDRFSNQGQLIELHLAHPNIHPPIAIFQQDLIGRSRFYLVTPCSQEMPAHPETSKVLKWGLQLADGLDYLHAHGVVLGEELHPSSFGLVDDKVVWRNFSEAACTPHAD